MFALKFEGYDGRYEVFSCVKYSVQEESIDKEPVEGLNYQLAVRMFRDYQDDNPQFEYVGPSQPYRTCYVMNASGKTIDVLR